ncbi:MAG: zinc transporter ZntB, partial [Proteobacteria bacterium]|nr:zinc transporter ZntB [Pseudomonadota bacterium]
MSNDGEAHDPTGLVHAYVLDGKGGGQALDWAGIARWTPHDGTLWVNFDYSLDRAAEWVRKEAGLDPVAIEALTDTDPRPR